MAFRSFANNVDPADTDIVDDVYVNELGVAALSIAKSDSPDPAFVGRNLIYTVVVTNNGPHDAQGVRATDNLPPSVTFVSATPNQGTCTQSEGSVTCVLGTIGNGSSASVTILVTPRLAGTISNVASAGASSTFDPSPANSDSEDTKVCPRRTSRRMSIPC